MGRSLYGDDHESYRDTVAEFLAGEVVPFHDDWDRGRFIDRAASSRAAKVGIYGVNIGQ
jgi:alkylation response protein AidB-like acyl-CoA dehydrogenase